MHGFVNSDARPQIVARIEEPPPHNLGAERALLGAVLLDNAVFAEVRRTLDAVHFHCADHGTLWAAISERIGAGERADPITLKGAVGDALSRYAGTLVKDACTTMNAPEYAILVKDAALRRQAIDVGNELIRDAQDGTLPLPAVLQATAAELAIVRGGIPVTEAPVVARCVADIEAVPISWLWPDRIACGKLSIIAGEPGVGKSQLTCAMAAAVTSGGTWPDGTRAPKGSAVIIACEDDAGDTIRPRLEAAGADLRRVSIIDWVISDGVRRHFDVGQHVEKLAAHMRGVGDVHLVVIDPISAYMGAADSHVVAEVRQALWPLQAMAAEMGAAVVLISHLNKGSSANGAMARVAGSGAFVAATRAAYMVGKDPADETKRRRIMAPLKTNVGKDDTTGFAYSVESCQRGDIATSRIVWEAGTVTVPAEDLLQRPAARGDDTSGALSEAVEFLKLELAEGPKPSSWIDKMARDAGISVATLRRARKTIGTHSRKGSSGGWLIELPDPSNNRE